MDNIKVEYSGDYPNLCTGSLIVAVNGKEWGFPIYCMRSGGRVWVDDNYDEHIEKGPWSIRQWPDNFPDHLKPAVVEAINDCVRPGCCGGCL